MFCVTLLSQPWKLVLRDLPACVEGQGQAGLHPLILLSPEVRAHGRELLALWTNLSRQRVYSHGHWPAQSSVPSSPPCSTSEKWGRGCPESRPFENPTASYIQLWPENSRKPSRGDRGHCHLWSSLRTGFTLNTTPVWELPGVVAESCPPNMSTTSPKPCEHVPFYVKRTLQMWWRVLRWETSLACPGGPICKQYNAWSAGSSLRSWKREGTGSPWSLQEEPDPVTLEFSLVRPNSDFCSPQNYHRINAFCFKPLRLWPFATVTKGKRSTRYKAREAPPSMAPCPDGIMGSLLEAPACHPAAGLPGCHVLAIQAAQWAHVAAGTGSTVDWARSTDPACLSFHWLPGQEFQC